MMMSLRKSLSETSAPRPEPKFQTLFAQLLELRVVGDPALQRDRLVLGPPGRFAAGAGIAAFAMFDDFGRALEGADLADAGDISSIPLDAELEILVWIEPLRVDAELSHAYPPPYVCDLPGHLLNLDNRQTRPA